MTFFKKKEARPLNVNGGWSGEGPLSTWHLDEEGIITAVPGSSRLASRLREMGVVPGVRIRVLRTGTALVVQVDGGRLCLRRKDAVAIRVASLKPFPRPPSEGAPDP